MMLPLHVVIVSASPIFSRSLQHLLAEEPDLFHSWNFGQIEAPPRPDVLLIAPHTWEEMAFWLPALRNHFAHSAWLVLAELRLVGMFLSVLEGYRCTALSSSARPEQLCTSLLEFARESEVSATATLLALFARAAPPLRSGRPPLLISARQLQCGCAASLGLSNRRISEVLHLGEATVKSHLHTLLTKLELSDREELGQYLEQALAPLSPSKRWSGIQSKVWKCETARPTNSRARQQPRRGSRSPQFTGR